jgi:hypothetical protein
MVVSKEGRSRLLSSLCCACFVCFRPDWRHVFAVESLDGTWPAAIFSPPISSFTHSSNLNLSVRNCMLNSSEKVLSVWLLYEFCATVGCCWYDAFEFKKIAMCSFRHHLYRFGHAELLYLKCSGPSGFPPFLALLDVRAGYIYCSCLLISLLIRCLLSVGFQNEARMAFC